MTTSRDAQNKNLMQENSQSDWDNNYDALKTFMDEYKRCPYMSSTDFGEIKLAIWMHHQKKKNHIKNDTQRGKWYTLIRHYFEFLQSDEELWDIHYRELKIFMDENNRAPLVSATTFIEKNLALWIETQKNDYKKNTGDVTGFAKRGVWEVLIKQYPQFLKTDEERWDDSLKDLKKFMFKHTRAPYISSDDSYERDLAKWYAEESEKHTLDLEKRTKWQFMMENHAGVSTGDDRWDYHFEKLEIFVDENKERPSMQSSDSEERKLGVWFTTQQNNYGKRVAEMSCPGRRSDWEGLMSRCEEEDWDARLRRLDGFMNIYNRFPYSFSSVSDERDLGKWHNAQHANYENGIIQGDRRVNWENVMSTHHQLFKTAFALWSDQLRDLDNFIMFNGRLPRSESSFRDERRRALWFSDQTDNSNSPEKIKALDEFKSKYPQIFRTNEEQWDDKLDELITYINDHEELPLLKSKEDDEKNLASWMNIQKKNYQANSMRQDIRKKWVYFCNAFHGCNLRTEQEIWNDELENLKTFIDENNRLPLKNRGNTREAYLSKWVDAQTKNCTSSEWTVFMATCPQFFKKSAKDIWNKTLNDVREFIEFNERIPFRRSRDPKEKRLGEWLYLNLDDAAELHQ